MDSDERLYVNEYPTYFEQFSVAWERGLIDEELLLDWVPAELAWRRVDPILEATRDMLDEPDLWSGFEALAARQAERA